MLRAPLQPGNKLMGKGLLIAVGFLASSGCAGTTHQVVPTGHDTYMVASHGTMGYSSAGAQKAKAYQYANDFCKAKDREVQTVSDRETDNCRSCLHTSRL